MRAIGLLLVAALIAAPLIEFLPLAAQHDPSAVFSQYIGCAALIAMAIAQKKNSESGWERNRKIDPDSMSRSHIF